MLTYIGNGAYCYANSLAMLLAASGETVWPGRIEALTGVGLGATLGEGDQPIWFDNPASPPDVGISRALSLLGFEFVEAASDDCAEAPLAALHAALESGPALLGPLDMGYLTYMPYSPQLAGIDHYVLAYWLDQDAVYLQDPEGFPYVFLAPEQLRKAWAAESIAYRRGAYRYWTAPRRVRRPDDDELYEQALASFQLAREDGLRLAARKGLQIGGDAIRSFADIVRDGAIAGGAREHLINFALPLAARRAVDYAVFFEQGHQQLARSKRYQAKLFGHCHTLAVCRNWAAMTGGLEELADLEDDVDELIRNA